MSLSFRALVAVFSLAALSACSGGNSSPLRPAGPPRQPQPSPTPLSTMPQGAYTLINGPRGSDGAAVIETASLEDCINKALTFSRSGGYGYSVCVSSEDPNLSVGLKCVYETASEPVPCRITGVTRTPHLSVQHEGPVISLADQGAPKP